MWKRLIVMLLLGVVYGKQAKNPAAKTHTRLPRLHHPSKRGTIVTTSNNEYTGTKPYRRQEVIHALNEKNVENDDDIESYGKVIDSNEDELVSKKESNAKAKSFVPDGRSSRPNSIVRTKELIAKIKEIQDKLFKRTSSKELADELDQMTPDSSVQYSKNKHLTNLAKENVTASKIEQDFFQLEIKSLDEVIKNISAKRFMKQNEFNKTTKNVINTNNVAPKMIDDSNNPVRRKIIPEEVVDKILEKFQQLRSEAKHMALLETQRDSLNEGASNKQVQGFQVDSSASNPYASIGPAKENLELKNRTGIAVKSIGVDLKQDNSLSLSLADPSTISLNNQFGGVQIPIESSAADAVKDLGSVKQMPGVPLMFIKSGEALVPVYGSDSHPKISYTDTGMAQLKSNPSVGLPSLPSNIVPLSSPQQQVATFMGLNPVNQFLQTTQSMQQSRLPYINNFIPAQLNQVPASSRCEIPGTICPTPTIAQLFQQASRLRQQVQQEQLEHMQQSGRNLMTLPSQQQSQQEQYFREYNQRQQQIQQLEQFKQEQQQLRAQQQQLAAGLSNFAQNNLESTDKDLHNPENIDRSQDNFPHFFPREESLQQQQHHAEADYPINNLFLGNSPSIQTEPSTVSLINDILKTPEMPRLAAQIMDENTPFQYRNQNEQASARNFNELPSGLTNSNSGGVQSMRTGDIQFNLKQNLARSNYPGESSMIGSSQNFNHEPLAASQLLQNYPTNPVFPLKKNPFSEANPERDDDDDNHFFRGKSVALNDISDPPSEQTEEEESRFRNQNPDELLNYANMRTMQRSFHPDSRPTASIDSMNVDDDRMSYDQRGSQRALMSVANGVDPSSLLDKIQGTELKGGLLGAGDPNWFSPTFKHREDKEAISDGSPDDLLESLRKQNDKLFDKDGRALAMEFRKSRLQTDYGRSRAGIPDGIDPSFADEIHEPLPERFDESSKESYLQNHLNSNTNNLFQNGHSRSTYQPTEFSILSGDMVQYKHGRMSVDSSNVINSFLSESPQYRNEILRPTSFLNKNDSLNKGIVRATITKNLPDDFIELRVNGEALDDKASVRSNVKSEKKGNHSGKTFRSKGPIQIQLSHAIDKKKIINIITQSKYNVTEDRKRAKISRVKVPV